jgi:Domain of unknown function (DUF4265)
MRSNPDTAAETIRVNAPVEDPDVPIWTEVMHAAPDPASPDQAVLVNVPFLVDGLNFGDLVRVGPEDDCGVRPIVEVVVPSGCVHVLVAAPSDRARDVIAELEELFPTWALRIENGNDTLLSMSIHPDLDPDEVIGVVDDLLEEAGDFDPQLEEGPAIGPVCESVVGRIAWPVAGPRGP